MSEARLPLQGIKVVEIGQALAGPLSGVIFADLGADVIKIEKPDGGDDARLWGPMASEDASLMFNATNRSKKSVILNLKSPDDLAKLNGLIKDADICIQNLRPGVADAGDFGPAALMAVNPRLIYCVISAFGEDGPLNRHPGMDPLAQAYGGVMTLTGRADDPPTFCAPAINDTATGMWAVIGALAALEERRHTGKGKIIGCSLFESAVHWVSGPLNAYNNMGIDTVRTGAASANLVPYQVFETADRPICIAAGNNRLFLKFAAVVGKPEWCDDPRFNKPDARYENRETLLPMIAGVFMGDTCDNWIAKIESVGVPCSPVNDIEALSKTEQLASTKMVQPIPGLKYNITSLPITLDGERPPIRFASPKLGEHTDEVLGAIGAAVKAAE
ncbi:MAG: CaiB/BaiF CoA transferase family protein [Alphaproteobacteria bacterium]|jgi:formyl-CoA transferase